MKLDHFLTRDMKVLIYLNIKISAPPPPQFFPFTCGVFALPAGKTYLRMQIIIICYNHEIIIELKYLQAQMVILLEVDGLLFQSFFCIFHQIHDVKNWKNA